MGSTTCRAYVGVGACRIPAAPCSTEGVAVSSEKSSERADERAVCSKGTPLALALSLACFTRDMVKLFLVNITPRHGIASPQLAEIAVIGHEELAMGIS